MSTEASKAQSTSTPASFPEESQDRQRKLVELIDSKFEKKAFLQNNELLKACFGDFQLLPQFLLTLEDVKEACNSDLQFLFQALKQCQNVKLTQPSNPNMSTIQPTFP